MDRGHEFPLSQRGRGGPVNILLKHRVFVPYDLRKHGSSLGFRNRTFCLRRCFVSWAYPAAQVAREADMRPGYRLTGAQATSGEDQRHGRHLWRKVSLYF